MPKQHKRATDWRKGSKRRIIAELCEKGYIKRDAYVILWDMVRDQTAPMIFSANVGGRRQPKPLFDQYEELKHEIGRVYALLGRAKSSSWESEEIPTEPETEDNSEEGDSEFPEEDDTPDNEEEEEEEEEEELKSPEIPIARGKQRVKSELEHFLAEVRRIRVLCEDRALSGSPLDSISMRPAQAAARLIPAGIPAAARA